MVVLQGAVCSLFRFLCIPTHTSTFCHCRLLKYVTDFVTVNPYSKGSDKEGQHDSLSRLSTYSAEHGPFINKDKYVECPFYSSILPLHSRIPFLTVNLHPVSTLPIIAMYIFLLI